MSKPVQRCICFNTTFLELKLSGEQSLQGIVAKFGCGTKCGMCRPYIQRMLETGEVAFDVIPLEVEQHPEQT